MNNKGYFTEEQMDRANLKTMANPLPEPWNGNHLLALLVVLSDKGVIADVEVSDSKQSVIEWYCTTKTEDVVAVLERVSKTPEFQTVIQFQKMMHMNPQAMKEAIEAIEAGWRPE